MSCSPVRSAFLSTIAIIAFVIVSQAHAAGSVTIIQESTVGLFGDYTLTIPSGSHIVVTGEEHRSFPTAEIGTYDLLITPPVDAQMIVTVDNGTASASSTQTHLTFSVADGETITVTLAYSYNGSLTVDSEPQEMHFELLGPASIRLTGVTPATFTNLAPGTYRVTFQKKKGCDVLSPIQRILKANEALTITGKFTCGAALPPPAPTFPTVTPVIPPPPAERTVRIWAAAQQAEVLAGGTVRFTITVKNTGERTVHGVSISAQFDPALLQTTGPLPRFGTANGNVVAWNIPEIYAGQFWTVSLPMTVSEAVEQGDRIALTARVSGNDVTTTDDAMLVAMAEVGVMTGLPQTGMRGDVLFLLGSLIVTGLFALASKTCARQRA